MKIMIFLFGCWFWIHIFFGSGSEVLNFADLDPDCIEFFLMDMRDILFLTVYSF